MATMMAQAGMSQYMLWVPKGSALPETSEHSGRMTVRSMMFAPMMLPTDSSDWCLRMAVMAVTSSGSDVPTAIMVTPMMASGTPSAAASAEPLSTISCAPMTIPAVPATNFTMLVVRIFRVTSGRSSVLAPISFLPEIRFSTMNSANSTSSSTLGSRLSSPESPNSASTTAAATIKSDLTPNWLRFTGPAMNTTSRPMIRPVLQVTEPMALPTAMSTLPPTAAMMDTSISGSVVAMDTMVAPTMNFGMPEASAIQLAASTKKSPPLTTRIRPSTNNSITRNRLI